ncbi:hypothetical protein BH09BAC3_BH09BAC3_30600 [soil metagenome]
MKSILYSVLVLITLLGRTATAQQATPEPPVAAAPPAEPEKEIEELRLKLNKSGSHYLKATFLNQVWFRFNDSNPGTQVLGEPTDQTFDIGLRRTRIQFYGQLTDHVFFYTQFGQNNFNYLTQNAGNRKLEAFFHDVLGEYKFSTTNEHLVLGGGLTITNGLSRFSQPSIGTIMSMDVPVFAQATVDQTDEFSRKLSIYARGQLGKFDYRLVLSDPFPVTTNGTTLPPIGTNATFAQTGHHKQYQGFFMWNFFDKEQHATPYMTGTYLGKKKVFNIEGGFIAQKNAMWVGTDPANPTYQDMNLWSVALFYDAPVNKDKGTAINAYLGYFGTDYGTGYLRMNNAMNPASSVVGSYPGGSQGNAFPMFGTGNQIYGQFGYLMSKGLLGEGNGALMPYITVQSAKFDRIAEQMNVYSAGINWFIKGHTSKLTLDYQNRPTYNADFTSNDRKGQVVLQYQIFF